MSREGRGQGENGETDNASEQASGGELRASQAGGSGGDADQGQWWEADGGGEEHRRHGGPAEREPAPDGLGPPGSPGSRAPRPAASCVPAGHEGDDAECDGGERPDEGDVS